MNPVKTQRGFSLLEILVAFAILAVSLGIVVRIFSTGMNAATLAEQYGTATQLAQSLLASVGVETPLVAGERHGVVSDQYRWHVFVTPMANHPQPKDGNGDVALADSEPVLMAVKVAISWGDGDSEPRAVELNSLKLVQAPRDNR